MQPIISHQWNVQITEAFKLQGALASKVIRNDLLGKITYIAGVDVAYATQGNKMFAAVVVLEANCLEVVEIATSADTVQFPYIPGLFSFRELPPICQAIDQLKIMPDLIVCDGHGIAHPRRFGLASHLGVLFDIPSIGCAKTCLIGEAKDPGKERGDFAPLLDNNEVIGMALRTQDNIKPVYISIGHRIALQTACDWILKLSPTYRLPQTTRLSDQIVRKLLKADI